MKKFKPLSMLGAVIAAGLMLAGCTSATNSAAPKETEGQQAQENAMESKTAAENMGMDETEEESTMALLDNESGFPVEFAKYRAGTETDQELFDRLGEMSYEVTQNAYTEPKFQNIYDNFWGAGIYVDVVNGDPLFCSRDKYDSGWGWPAFTKPISEDLIVNKEDLSHGLNRTEVRSSGANSHLGHVFNDGPADRGGLHYCINSASLKFIPMDQMEEMGYGDYLYLFDKEEESK